MRTSLKIWRQWKALLLRIVTLARFFFVDRPKLVRLIRNRRVLIIGSGPSAKSLRAIPDDMLVFACNCSPEVLVHNRLLKRQVDLYLCNKKPMQQYADRIEPILDTILVNLFVTRDIKYIRVREREGFLHYRNTIQDISSWRGNGYFLRRLIQPETLESIRGNSTKRFTSAGLTILQYALYFGAREIYLCGIDLDARGHAFADKSTEAYLVSHRDLDHNFMNLVAKRYDYVYSAVSGSPIESFVPYKPLQ